MSMQARAELCKVLKRADSPGVCWALVCTHLQAVVLALAQRPSCLTLLE